MTTTGGEQGPVWPIDLPNGLYVREYVGFHEQTPPDGEDGTAYVWRWTVTGRSQDFWWDIVLTGFDTWTGGFELRCTRCGHRDQGPSVEGMLGLIRAGAHFHNVDPSGGL